MALYIVTEDNNEGFKWYIGQKSPLNAPNKGCKISEVIEVQADGDELEHIKKLFLQRQHQQGLVDIYTIPIPNKRVCNWYGDLAKLIAGNL